MPISPNRHRLAACLLCFTLMAVLSVSARAADTTAGDILSYLAAGESHGPLQLTGQGGVELVGDIPVAGSKALVIPEGMTLTLAGEGALTLKSGSSLTLSGGGSFVVDGGSILNQGVIIVQCPMTITSADALENRGYGSHGWMRIGSGGMVTLDNDTGAAILCAATNYNATVTVENGGSLTISGGGTGIRMTDFGPDAAFATGTLQVCRGGTLIMDGAGTALDGQGAGGQFLSLEAGGTTLVAGASPGRFSGSTSGFALDPDTYIVYLGSGELSLPEGAPAPYYGAIVSVSDPENADNPAEDYHIQGEWPHGTIRYGESAYYPLRRGEVLTISADGRADNSTTVDENLAAGDSVTLVLGETIRNGASVNTTYFFLLAVAATVMVVMFIRMRKAEANR